MVSFEKLQKYKIQCIIIFEMHLLENVIFQNYLLKTIIYKNSM